jgi:hypothetical protein
MRLEERNISMPETSAFLQIDGTSGAKFAVRLPALGKFRFIFFSGDRIEKCNFCLLANDTVLSLFYLIREIMQYKRKRTFSQRFTNVFSSFISGKTVNILLLYLILVALPVTISLAQQHQSLERRVSSSSMLPPPGYSHLIFDDMFSGLTLNSTKWIPQIADQTGIWNDNGKLPYPYSAVGNEGKYNAEYGNTDQVVVNNGLTLNAQRDNTFSGYSWKAGYIDTHNKFTFNQGFVQVRAKMPDSTTGGWASIWFLEGGGEIDLQESGYTGCGRSVVNQCLAMNLHTSGNKQILYNTGVDLSATYHIYGMEYKPGQSITMYFDGKQVAQFTSNIPTGAYTIILTETIAQNASGWHTVASNSTPSPMSPFQTSEVQVWTLDIPTPASLITAIPTLTFTPMPTPTPTVFNIIPPMVSITKRRMLDT